MQTITPLAPVFVAIAVVFLAATVRNWLKEEGKLSPARKTWLWLVFLFSGIAIALCCAHALL